MRDIFRPGKPGRGALTTFIFLVSATVCLGQEAPSTPAVKQETPVAAPAETAKTPEMSPATPVEPPSATNPPKDKVKPSKKGKNAQATGPGEISATGVQEKPYEIGPEDVLFLNVLHQPDVSSQLSVRPDGFISVRFAGEVKAAGLTTQQLSDLIAEKLTQYFNHPEVIIQVMRINSKKYYVSGEVKKPGAYTLGTPKTVLEAIIEAGGLADFAKKKSIYVLRGQQRIPFNFNDVSKGKNLRQNILLQNGDVIQVP